MSSLIPLSVRNFPMSTHLAHHDLHHFLPLLTDPAPGGGGDVIPDPPTALPAGLGPSASKLVSWTKGASGGAHPRPVLGRSSRRGPGHVGRRHPEPGAHPVRLRRRPGELLLRADDHRTRWWNSTSPSAPTRCSGCPHSAGCDGGRAREVSPRGMCLRRRGTARPGAPSQRAGIGAARVGLAARAAGPEGSGGRRDLIAR